MAISHSKEEQMVDDHFALVVSQALKFNLPSAGITDLDDLISVGSIGLLKAIRGFDEGRNIKFSTYATTCIQNEMKRELKRFNSHISLELLSDIEQETSNGIWEFMPDYLTEVEKQVLHMRLVENKTFKEIGNHMDRTKSWASAKMIEILDKLRESNVY